MNNKIPAALLGFCLSAMPLSGLAETTSFNTEYILDENGVINFGCF
ncbi:MAG: hypothetical protein ACI8WB_005908 [Phenylobacterium sp.]|jgi:hypothetical protein